MPEGRILLGNPSPAIGDVQHTYTDVAPNGRRIDDTPGTQITTYLAGFIWPGLAVGFFAFAAFGGIALGLDVFDIWRNKSYGLVGGVGVGLGLLWSGWYVLSSGRESDSPMTVFVGTEGVERYARKRAGIQHDVVRFADVSVLREQSALSVGVKFFRAQKNVNYKYASSFDHVRLVDETGDVRINLRVQYDAHEPDAATELLELNAVVIELRTRWFMALSRALLEAGEPVVFQLHGFEDSRRPPTDRIEIARDAVSYVAVRIDRRFVAPPAEVTMEVAGGRMSLTGLGEIERSKELEYVSDFLPLMEIAQSVGVRIGPAEIRRT